MSPPSMDSPGRERAIETLMDMEPQGPLFRASRILDEAVPQALHSRPNLVTRAALVEQAHGLGDAPIDSLDKYERLYPPPASDDSSSLRRRSTVEQERILSHHASLQIKPSSTPRPSLDALLSQLYPDEDDDWVWRRLLSNDDEQTSLESLLAQVCRTPSVAGGTVAALSVLLRLDPTGKGKAGRRSDGSILRTPLLVGSILSLLPPPPLKVEEEFSLDPHLLSYLGDAASIYQERLEVLQRQLQPQSLPTATPVAEGPQQDADGPLDDTRGTPVPEEDDDDEDVIVGRNDDSPPPLVSRRRSRDLDESSSSSSSSANSQHSRPQLLPGEGEEEPDPDDSEEDDDEEEDDDDEEEEEPEEEAPEEEEEDALQEALAMSLEDHFAEAAAEDMARASASQEQAGGDGSSPANIHNNPSAPIPTTPLVSSRLAAPPPLVTEAAEELTLPPLPVPPALYPYQAMLDAGNATNDVDVDESAMMDSSACAYTDPSELSKYGAVPPEHVLMHLLRVTLGMVQERRQETTSSKQDCPVSVPGGMGGALFSSSNNGRTKPSTADTTESFGASLRLLVACVISLAEGRDRALENLRNMLSPPEEPEADEEEDEPPNPLLPEDDDPALALAMNYMEESASTASFESLQAKGMKRKAAAAAHDMALRLKSRQEQTEAWKKRIKLLSQCTLIATRTLKTFMQGTVSQWLQQRSLTKNARSITDCHNLLPANVRSRLSTALTSIMSVSTVESFSVLLAGDGVNPVWDLLLPLPLYQEALATWGESLPVFHCSSDSRRELLENALIHDCEYDCPAMDVDSLEDFPSSELEVKKHRLQMIFRRFCVSDVLDGLVAHPITYNPDDGSPMNSGADLDTVTVVTSQETCQASALVRSLRLAMKSCIGAEKVDLKRLYLAVCHRCNVNILMWDGFYSCASEDLSEVTSPSPAAAVSATESLRVNPNPSNSLVFESTKCSDSIAILANATDSGPSANGYSAHQRASKVWGTVLSSTCFGPKTGVHRWALRLDKCERGHVFVGVATSQATTRTYVGGDKYGWGVIGTQALWHDRRKIRGDYGATFRTGSIIIVTLDTDVGTLSYSSWKDSSNSSSFSVDPLMQTFSSPRRQSQSSGGTLEDWGIAFEGLPLDARLYPAVGLYQRDDRVTLLSVESTGKSSSREILSGGLCFYPRLSSPLSSSRIAHIRRHNSLLSWDGIQYVKEALASVSDDPEVGHALMQSIASALCMVPPAIPILSQRLALYLLPQLSRFIRDLDGLYDEPERPFSKCLQMGDWIIRATGSSGKSSNGDFEGYVVNFKECKNADGQLIGFQGSGVGTTGKSKNGIVTITGTVCGSSLHFVEEWTDGVEEEKSPGSEDDASSSCVINARLSLDGEKFDGTYRNVQYGTIGHISGVLSTAGSRNRSKEIIKGSTSLLCLAHGHLSCILGEDMAGDHALFGEKDGLVRSTTDPQVGLSPFLSSPLLANGLEDPEGTRFLGVVQALKKLHSPPLQLDISTGSDDPFEIAKTLLGLAAEQEKACSATEILRAVEAMDKELIRHSGAKGSLSSLCPAEYAVCRQKIISVMLHYALNVEELNQICHEKVSAESPFFETLVASWRNAVSILDNSLRESLASSTEGKTRREVAVELCDLYNTTSQFLLSSQRIRSSQLSLSILRRLLSSFYSRVKGNDDVLFLKKEMERATSRAFLRAISLRYVTSVLPVAEGDRPNLAAHSLTMEYFAVSLPRLLGVAWSKQTTNGMSPNMSGSAVNGVDDLGGHYLSQLSGSGLVATDTVSKLVHELYLSLGSFLLKIVAQSKLGSDPSLTSLTLALLAVWSVSLRAQDITPMISKSGILQVLPTVLTAHRESIRTKRSPSAEEDEDASVRSVKEIHHLVQRDLSRSLLRAATSITHVISFQVANHVSASSVGPHDPRTVLQSCLGVLFDELAQGFPFIESIVCEEQERHARRHAGEEWEKWAEAILPLKPSQSSTSKRNELPSKKKSGVSYLIENGSHAPVLGAPASPQKNVPRGNSKTGKQGSTRSEALLRLLGPACHQYLSQWLHALCCATRSSASLSILSKHDDWVDILLQAVGLSCTRTGASELESVKLRETKDGDLVPDRYRARILRLLPALLAKLKPSDEVIRGFFALAGASSSTDCNGMGREGHTISRETVSLLRHLHSPAQGEWRQVINQVIASTENSSDDQQRTGVLSFFAGSIGAIDRGSYVLLRPATAASLTSDAQAASSSKSTAASGGSGAGVGGTPHHIVGNGTAGIVAGLCRNEASAGIVSSVDAKSGMCEVILMQRTKTSGKASIGARSTDGVEGGLGSSRFTLTVRALRTPLSEVAHAEEVPLFLDTTLETDSFLQRTVQNALDHTLEKFLSQLKAARPGDESEVMREEEKTSQLYDSCDDADKCCKSLLALRSAVVLASDERLLQRFAKSKVSASAFSKLLERASYSVDEATSLSEVVNTARAESLSALPRHEAKYNHIVSMLREISFQESMFDSTALDCWKDILSNYKARLEKETELKPSSVTDSSQDTFRTPPPRPGATTDTQPTAEAGLAREESTGTQVSARESSIGTNSSEEDEDNDAAATAAAHLREAAIAQMAELGLPRSWSELALRRTGGTNIEAAVHFCLERGGDMERLLAEERERERMMQRQISGGPSMRRRNARGGSASANHLLQQLLEMGFPSRWCAEALSATSNNVDEALTWILTNGERLSAEDEGMEEDDEVDEEDNEGEDDSEEDEEDEAMHEPESATDELNEERHPTSDRDTSGERTTDAQNLDVHESNADEMDDATTGWTGSVTPLRFISGRSIINPQTLAVSGLPTGGFSSVGTKGIMLTAGKWYYEAVLETAGCLQIGWADGSFSGHCNADRGDGCGDGPSSWAYDGWRRYRWHSNATEWGCRWKEGDVVGCLVDMDEHVLSFTLNGRGEEIGMGKAFSGSGFRPCGGVYACVSFNRREKLRLILGGKGSEPFKYEPPTGYKGVGDAVLDSVEEHSRLIMKESIISNDPDKGANSGAKRFVCDFSDGEHGHELFAWQHRYYGSDASVHLGSGRSPKSSSGSTKTVLSGESSADLSAIYSVSSRIRKEWSRHSDTIDTDSIDALESVSQTVTRMKDGYTTVAKELRVELIKECMALSILYARKTILHTVVTMGESFDLSSFVSDSTQEGNDEELVASQRLWRVLDVCVSLRSAGWVGEAGAMALAAEALGLGISGNDNLSRMSPSERSLRDSNASLTESGEDVMLPFAGISQFLSTASRVNLADVTMGSSRQTASSLAACAEAALGGDGGGGPLVFLQKGLQSAVKKSISLRKLLTAVVRQSVRLLAVVDYAGDDSSVSENVEDDDTDGSPSPFGRKSNPRDEDADADKSYQPDARLASFLTGLLLSEPIRGEAGYIDDVCESLFEAWSIGLLSASAPWRMISALHVSGILNLCPRALSRTVEEFPTLARFYGRLQSTVVRRVWAERAAVPVCSRYVQAMIELLASVKRAVDLFPPPASFMKMWDTLSVDAATPLPMRLENGSSQEPEEKSLSRSDCNWEWEDGWLANDNSWEVWTGSAKFLPVEWTTPSRSAVRTLMDGGDGPPFLREGCFVMRGLDWDEEHNEDGKTTYDEKKAEREREKRALQEQEEESAPSPEIDNADRTVGEGGEASDPVADDQQVATTEGSPEQDMEDPTTGAAPERPTSSSGKKKRKRRKLPSPKLPIGTVVSVESWNGIPAMGRRVRWNLTGEEGVYRYGGDGGRFDLSHVEVNDRCTRVKKRHPLPESAEQCAVRHGFGAERKCSVVLRLRKQGKNQDEDGEVQSIHHGILEWPDFGAGVRVDCIMHADGAVTITEQELVYGSKDSGWEPRFGQPSYVPGTVMVLSPTGSLKSQGELDARLSFQSLYEELLGSNSFSVKTLRNRADASKLRVTTEMRLFRGRRASDLTQNPSHPPVNVPGPPPMHFDRDFHASSIALSKDGRTATCISPDGRGTAFASLGFTKGVHYWEVKIEQADIGSIFIGVAEKPNGSVGTAGSSGFGSSFGQESSPRLNRWHGWGFVNFRATFTSGAERVYGAHCHAGDTVGVLLDADAGRISYFFDGLKYGEHILNDLGCAFENISPFGFNADGCGSGGSGQGAPSGIEGGRGGRYPAQGCVKPRSLWPVIGLRHPGDRVTISTKWMSSLGVDGPTTLRNVLAVEEVLTAYTNLDQQSPASRDTMPKWFVEEALHEYNRWRSARWYRSETRGKGPHRLANFGLDVDLDTSELACASACASLGLSRVLLPGDRVVVKRSAGRMLELAEEAVVLGTYQGRLFYRIVSQKSEGGSLTEGGGRAWFWDESEVVNEALVNEKAERKGYDVPLPSLGRFRCLSSGGLKIVYEGGAVVRSDLEIFDGSVNLGSIPFNTVIPQKDVLERRVNSCGVIRYRIRFEEVGEGWISSNIRGGKEEPIVQPVDKELPGNINTDTSEAKDESVDTAEPEDVIPVTYDTPLECALSWHSEYKKVRGNASQSDKADFSENTVELELDEFENLLAQGVLPGLSIPESDELLVHVVSTIADFSEGGDAVDCLYTDVLASLTFAMATSRTHHIDNFAGSPGANQAAAAMLSTWDGPLPSIDALLARIAMLRALNRRTRVALPWMSVRPSQEGTAIFGGLCGHGSSVERAGRNRLTESSATWVQPPSIASKLRKLRGLLFTSVKRTLLESITHSTTTPTPLSHDEYELPREIRTVRVNRLKARRAMAGNDNRTKRRHSVFMQLSHETRSWGGAALRRGFVAKGHGGQKRAFKVKLVGEGVNDYSGPYREAFTDAMSEVLDVDDKNHGSLGVLDPTPNHVAEIGENRELYMFSAGDRDLPPLEEEGEGHVSAEESRIRDSFASLILPRDEVSREVEESLVFLGRLVGTACRHGIPVDLPLPLASVWKAVAEDPTGSGEQLKELDTLAWRRYQETGEKPGLLSWQQRMLNSFVDGVSNVLPAEVLTILSGEELRDIMCGNPEVDVDLLKRVVEYEGYTADDAVITYFWEALHEMSSDDRKKFLQFVWARNRLPMKESDFEAPFKIQRDSGNSEIPDTALPSASTCFFSLTLPEYTSKSILKQKLQFAIENVCTMESDYVTNDAEVGEGWRGF